VGDDAIEVEDAMWRRITTFKRPTKSVISNMPESHVWLSFKRSRAVNTTRFHDEALEDGGGVAADEGVRRLDDDDDDDDDEDGVEAAAESVGVVVVVVLMLRVEELGVRGVAERFIEGGVVEVALEEEEEERSNAHVP
jgi:hypothetical protein